MQILRFKPRLRHKYNNSEKIWKFRKFFLSLQRLMRNRVEPRCAERWHGCRVKPVEMMSNSTLPLGFFHLFNENDEY